MKTTQGRPAGFLSLVMPFVAVMLFSASASWAQQKSLKNAIVGSWTITSVVDQYENGKKVSNFGAAKGNVSFDAAGRFSQILVGEAQPDMKTADPRKPDAPVVAYYGSYTVNESTKTITGKVEGASYSPRVGSDQIWTVEIKDDTLILVGAPRKDQVGTFFPRLELKRAK